MDWYELQKLVGVHIVFSTKVWFTKISVASESTSACIENNLEVLVVLRVIKRYNKVL